jgi:uncharacterized protein (UPF0335 family)
MTTEKNIPEEELNAENFNKNLPIEGTQTPAEKQILVRLAEEKHQRELERLDKLEKLEEERRNESPEKLVKRIIEESVREGIEKYKESIQVKKTLPKTERQESKAVYDQMIEEYKNLNVKLYQIRKDINNYIDFTESVIKKPLKHYIDNIEGTEKKKVTIDELKQMILEGKTKKEICTYFGKSDTYISGIMTKNGLKMSDYKPTK